MPEPARRPRYTLDQYLRLEEMSNVRHEYLEGEIYGMPGGTPEHGRIAANIIMLLGMHTASRRCAVFTSDVRVRVTATGLDTYPDVTVVCGRLEYDSLDPHAIANPTLLVEVTSPSTEAYDRGEKLNHYRRIPSLQEIVIVAHGERRGRTGTSGSSNAPARRDRCDWHRSPRRFRWIRSISIPWRDELNSPCA
jgi:Uma2 family endonuclease